MGVNARALWKKRDQRTSIALSRPFTKPMPKDTRRGCYAMTAHWRPCGGPWSSPFTKAFGFSAKRGKWPAGKGACWPFAMARGRHWVWYWLAARMTKPPGSSVFFYISKEWKGGGHGTRLLRAVRRSLSGVPLQIRLPLTCYSAVDSLEAAGFTRQYVDAFEVATYEAPAKWDE